MSDEATRRWLDEEEREILDDFVAHSGPSRVDLMRKLAETRQALARLEETALFLIERHMAEVPQPHCPDVPGHLRGALQMAEGVLRKMPRPR